MVARWRPNQVHACAHSNPASNAVHVYIHAIRGWVQTSVMPRRAVGCSLPFLPKRLSIAFSVYVKRT